MPAIARDEAVARLTKAIEQASADDLREIYNELFPDQLVVEQADNAHVTPLVEKIGAHIHHGLEVEEIVDLWHVVFPKDRNVHHDEETGMIRYSECYEPLRLAE